MVSTAEVSRRRNQKLAWGLILGLIAVIAVVWIVEEALDEEVADVGVTIEDIVESPATYVGQTVTVSGEIDERYASDIFTLEGKEFGFDDKILVMGATRGLVPPQEDARVQVTGEVRTFSIYEFERDLGMDFNDEAVAVWVGLPVLVARSIELRETR